MPIGGEIRKARVIRCCLPRDVLVLHAEGKRLGACCCGRHRAPRRGRSDASGKPQPCFPGALFGAGAGSRLCGKAAGAHRLGPGPEPSAGLRGWSCAPPRLLRARVNARRRARPRTGGRDAAECGTRVMETRGGYTREPLGVQCIESGAKPCCS